MSFIVRFQRPLMVRKVPTRGIYSRFEDDHVKAKDKKVSKSLPPMTKQNLARMVAAEHDLSIAKSDRILTTILDSIVEVSRPRWLCLCLLFCSRCNAVCQRKTTCEAATIWGIRTHIESRSHGTKSPDKRAFTYSFQDEGAIPTF
mmetsp:Transcript_25510/g.59271  ORF Transcript_25510/g.59271 Transcript_25510/m.59271 type:complete len:145 (+) Transcript_25510:185-619(+)